MFGRKGNERRCIELLLLFTGSWNKECLSRVPLLTPCIYKCSALPPCLLVILWTGTWNITDLEREAPRQLAGEASRWIGSCESVEASLQRSTLKACMDWRLTRLIKALLD